MALDKIDRNGPAYVYMLKSDTVKAVYYGMTQNPIQVRFEDHISSLKRNRHFNQRLQLLWNSGVQDWTQELVDTAPSREDGCRLEKELIKGDSFALNINYRNQQRRPERVTPQMVLDIKAYKAQGMKQIYIAKLFNLSGCAVSRIINGYYDHKVAE